MKCPIDQTPLLKIGAHHFWCIDCGGTWQEKQGAGKQNRLKVWLVKRLGWKRPSHLHCPHCFQRLAQPNHGGRKYSCLECGGAWSTKEPVERRKTPRLCHTLGNVPTDIVFEIGLDLQIWAMIFRGLMFLGHGFLTILAHLIEGFFDGF